MRPLVAGLLAAGALALPVAQASARNAYFSVGDSVVAIDTATNAPVGSPISLPAGSAPQQSAITPDGTRLVVPTSANDAVIVIDITTGVPVGAPISFPSSANPIAVAITPDGTRAYVANSGSDSVSVIEIATNAVVGPPIPVGDGPQSIVITPDGSRAYVVNSTSDDLSVIDTATNAPAGPPISVGGFPQGVAITPDGTRVFVANCGSDHVTAYETATNTLANIPTAAGDCPKGIAITPDGALAYVANSVSKDVTVIDVSKLTKVGGPIPVGGSDPISVAITPDGTRAYVANFGSGDASVIDLSTNALVGSPIPVGMAPRAVAIVPNQGPSAAFSARNATGGTLAGFDAGASSDPDGAPARYDWDFGDGQTLADGGPTPMHSYQAEGIYTATLTVTDNEGCSTADVFGGRSAFCNGSQIARTQGEVDLDPPSLNLSGRRKPRLGPAVVAKVRSDEAGSAEAEGLFIVKRSGRGGGRSNGKKLFDLVERTEPIPAGQTIELRLRIPKRGRRAAKQVLSDRGRVSAIVQVDLTDAAGNIADGSRRVKMRPQR